MVITSLKHTTPELYIWAMDGLNGDPEMIGFPLPPDGRVYTYDHGAYPRGNIPTDPGCTLASAHRQGGDFIFRDPGTLGRCTFADYTQGNCTFDSMIECFDG